MESTKVFFSLSFIERRDATGDFPFLGGEIAAISCLEVEATGDISLCFEGGFEVEGEGDLSLDFEVEATGDDVAFRSL